MKTYIEHIPTGQQFHTYTNIVEDDKAIQTQSWDGDPVRLPKSEYRIVPLGETLTDRIAYWTGRYSEESHEFHLMFSSTAQQDLDQAIQYEAYSVALDVAAKGLSYVQMRQLVGEELKAAIQHEIDGLRYCIELNNKHWIMTPKPWVKNLEKIKAEARIRKYQEIISQLERLIA